MKLNRNNADINKLRDKKVAVRLVGKDAEKEKTYTIKDVVENEGKVYRSTNDCIYKYDKNFLYYKAIWELSADWKKTGLTLGEIAILKFIEYKPEPKKITFKEALKEMEQGKVCRSLHSGTEYLLSNNHFEELNGNYTTLSFNNYTTLSYKEIKEGWVVLE